jgi:hypothetical protein
MKIKSFLLFESKDSGYFIDMKDQLEEYFPTLKIKTGSYKNEASLDIEFYNRGDKGIDFINFTNILEFWIEVLDNNGYKYSTGNMSLRKEYLGRGRIANRNFKNWTDLKKYTLQFGGQDHSEIRTIDIQFN